MPKHLSPVGTAAMSLALRGTGAFDGFADRGDIVHLPEPLKQRLITLANRPQSARLGVERRFEPCLAPCRGVYPAGCG
jgi:hypothetical protein